jgi:hypothetical protein
LDYQDLKGRASLMSKPADNLNDYVSRAATATTTTATTVTGFPKKLVQNGGDQQLIDHEIVHGMVTEGCGGRGMMSTNPVQ